MFKGSLTALITPFENGEIDYDRYEAIIEYQINNGTSGIIPCGTTGEAPTLSSEEHKRLVECAVKTSNGRIPVIAGSGTNSTAQTIEKTKIVKDIGADAALIVAPYYNKPTQEGLYLHFKAVHDAVDIPIIIYNVPSRTVCQIEYDTVCRLAELPRIAGIKDATSNLSRTSKLRRDLGDDFCLLSGEDATAGGYLAQGGDGCISVSSNIVPDLCARMHDSWEKRKIEDFLETQYKLMELHEAMFCESSPAPVKYAASLLGLCSEEVRAPLTPASEKCKMIVNQTMKNLGLELKKAI